MAFDPWKTDATLLICALELNAKGYSAARIANVLGLSKGQVIGKLHRTIGSIAKSPKQANKAVKLLKRADAIKSPPPALAAPLPPVPLLSTRDCFAEGCRLKAALRSRWCPEHRIKYAAPTDRPTKDGTSRFVPNPKEFP